MDANVRARNTLYSVCVCVLLASITLATGQSQNLAKCDRRNGTAVIADGDLVHISVPDVPSLDEHLTVSSDGCVRLYLAGRVKISGLTVEVAGEAVSEALSRGHFVRDAQAMVVLEHYADESVIVGGQVANPGAYAVTRNIRLADIFSLAGGLTSSADANVLIKGRTGAGSPFCTVHYDGRVTAVADEVMIVPGESVVVNRAALIYILGNVMRPGPVIIPEGGLTVTKAIALGYGVEHRLKRQKARILKYVATLAVETIVDLDAIEQGRSPDVQITSKDILYIEAKENVKDNPSAGFIAASAWALSR